MRTPMSTLRAQWRLAVHVSELIAASDDRAHQRGSFPGAGAHRSATPCKRQLGWRATAERWAMAELGANGSARSKACGSASPRLARRSLGSSTRPALWRRKCRLPNLAWLDRHGWAWDPVRLDEVIVSAAYDALGLGKGGHPAGGGQPLRARVPFGDRRADHAGTTERAPGAARLVPDRRHPEHLRRKLPTLPDSLRASGAIRRGHVPVRIYSACTTGALQCDDLLSFGRYGHDPFSSNAQCVVHPTSNVRV